MTKFISNIFTFYKQNNIFYTNFNYQITKPFKMQYFELFLTNIPSKPYQ